MISFHPLASSPQGLLKVLYIITTCLSIFMVVWILVFPSSWLVGFSQSHDDLFLKVSRSFENKISPQVVLKYGGHPAIQFSHILPSAFWAGSIPFQLHPGLRKKYKTIHRRIGYIFLGTCLLMALGIFLIIDRKLNFEYDYPEAPPSSQLDRILFKVSIFLSTSWFLWTAIMAVLRARSKDFHSHKKYIYRHVASGIWVAIQRIIINLSGPKKDSEHMRESFSDAGTKGLILSISLGEVAVFLEGRIRNKLGTQNTKRKKD